MKTSYRFIKKNNEIPEGATLEKVRDNPTEFQVIIDDKKTRGFYSADGIHNLLIEGIIERIPPPDDTILYQELVRVKPMDKRTFYEKIKKQELAEYLTLGEWGNELGYCIEYPDGSMRWVSNQTLTDSTERPIHLKM